MERQVEERKDSHCLSLPFNLYSKPPQDISQSKRRYRPFSGTGKIPQKSGLLTNFLSLQWVPDVAVEVIVAGKDKAARVGERHRRDACVQASVLVSDHFLVGAQIVHLAGAVVGACDEGVSIGEELPAGREEENVNGSSKCLFNAFYTIPNFQKIQTSI